MVEDMVSKATRRMKNIQPEPPNNNTSQPPNKNTSQASSTGGADSASANNGQSTLEELSVTQTEHLSIAEGSKDKGPTSTSSSAEDAINDAASKDNEVVEVQLTKDKQSDTVTAYRNLLSGRESDGPLLVVNKAPDLHTLRSVSQSLTDREKLWEKIVESKLANDEANADFLLRIYLSLPKEDITKTLRVPVDLSELRSTSADAAIPTQRATSVDKTVQFIKGSVPNHCDIGFTPFFDKNIREFKGPLPLTIFDREWQEDAVNFHSGKKSKSDEKDGVYTGYEYPNEWSQSFSAWSNNFRSFLITYRDIYKIPEFAEWIVAHKANVDEIIANEGFLTGFRYDMIIRANAFAYRVETSNGASVVDISVMRKDVREKSWAVTRKLDELDFKDNPYAQGGIKAGFDPKTGRPKIGKNHKSFTDASPYSSGPNSSGYGNSSRGRGGFRKKSFG
ncbi:hypothetical protein PGTUg99_007331 [Puccinia graminis f. sp. tritici]|uniref:Uncharacterized protein n=1 Tax=Puccinia graminis f. sp. tritici TaxID=56615 RepID=A0A5B0RUQ6_PUCGR|nr:hypothetical protein PGTUg99_007331 [Puccinia graminis f. sp. tritici]